MFPNKSQFSHHPRSVFGPVNAPSNVAPGQELPRQVPVTPTLQTPAASWTPYPSVPHMDAPAHLSLPPLPLPPLPQTPLQHAAMTVQQLLETDM
ncbi:hypothetical protein CAEBREN_31318 [Caenorhabditis brenneri]|uniref:Uncharacterized protein n=1 Tax=Caenorhabditis brenneri TaxID=135651 RepID=G0M9M1_CAEBE|nr:hypothetical protein CAEBREN_31318 [Caenorhabditis brenneri]